MTSMQNLAYAQQIGRDGSDVQNKKKRLERKGCYGSFADANAFSLFQTQVEVALAAADGDLNVAVEILMSQQVCK